MPGEMVCNAITAKIFGRMLLQNGAGHLEQNTVRSFYVYVQI